MKIIKIPFGAGGLGHGNGAKEAPSRIEESLKECFANENGLEVNYNFSKININESDINKSHDNIFEYVSKLSSKAILLGGDHSITYSTVKGFSKSNKDFYFIVFDAHPDLMQDFSPPTQEGYLEKLIEEKFVDASRCVLVGLRNWDKQEIDYLNEKKIKYYTSIDIFDRGIKSVISEIINFVDSDIYLSLDIDVVDPVEAIGTGYIEHGGMSSRELIYCVQQLAKFGKLKMVDLVEINPTKDVNDITSKLAAKIIVELGEF